MKISRYTVLFAAIAATSVAHGQNAMTIEQLAKSTACSAPVFITDSGKEGMFVKSSDSSDQLNGGTTLQCNGTNYLYKRVYDNAINARWFGLSVDAPDNSAAVQNAINAARNGQEVLIPEGTYRFLNSITLRDGTYIHLTARGTLSFGARDGIIVEGRFGHVVELTRLLGRPWEDHPTYGYVGSGITLVNAQFAKVSVNWIDGFQNAIKLTAKGRNGTQYNKIDFDGLRQNDVGILLTTESDVPKNWVTENTFTGGKITGVTGVLSAPGAGADPFNGNKFYNVGFEGITTAVDATGFSRNIFIAPRVMGAEGVLNGFKFSADSINNTIITTALYEAAFVSNGISGNAGGNTLVLGTLSTPSGRTSGVLSVADDKGRFLGVIRDKNTETIKESKSRILSLDKQTDVSN
ncbi:hypothetical protein [Rugamonas aquatica]|uniref:Pectate lyase superfamily protein domain-containing protein n=1 Tax=Rugamonas aquatica TaxID=2743357 RepID=A0A6A7MY46_9BURK|nr:hypothetical protein [Rugamonas aquatica]MQA37669.1 hypothetical protein [Rugamonas aquatica]